MFQLEKEIDLVSSQTEPFGLASCCWGLSEFADCGLEDDEGHKILPPEGEVGGRQREAENLEPSGEDSGRAL